MARRYGRNQKRRARDEIIKLKAELSTCGYRMRAAEHRLANAESAAFERFVRDAGRYEMFCARAVDEIARLAGPQLLPFAEELMRHANKHRPMLRFDASRDATDIGVDRITVEWPAVRYHYAVMS